MSFEGATATPWMDRQSCTTLMLADWSPESPESGPTAIPSNALRMAIRKAFSPAALSSPFDDMVVVQVTNPVRVVGCLVTAWYIVH